MSTTEDRSCDASAEPADTKLELIVISTGQADADWPGWYADYLVREQAGEEVPS
jgi:hypothetical protein